MLLTLAQSSASNQRALSQEIDQSFISRRGRWSGKLLGHGSCLCCRSDAHAKSQQKEKRSRLGHNARLQVHIGLNTWVR
jgi:hypothetical protein